MRIGRKPAPVHRAGLALPLAVAIVLLAPGGIDGACNIAPMALDDAARAYDQSIADDVLANDVDDDQALTVSVTSETCPGTVTVDFDLVTYTPSPALDQGCQIHYTVTDGEGLSASATVTVSMITEIFADGFESGDAMAWSAACPPSCS